MNEEELEIEELKKSVADNSGIPPEEFNRRWDQFLSNAVTNGLSKEEADEIRRQFRQQTGRKTERAAGAKVTRTAAAARPQPAKQTARAPQGQVARQSGDTREAAAERLLAEKEAEIARLEAELASGGLGLRKTISFTWKLSIARGDRDKAIRELNKVRQAKAGWR